jgi:hypothetical protein
MVVGGALMSDPPYVFSRIAGAVMTSWGFVVADGSSAELRWFDKAGRFRGVLAKRGGGPSDLTEVTSVFLLDSATAAVATFTGKLVLFRDGAFLHAHEPPRPSLALPQGIPIPLRESVGARTYGFLRPPVPRASGETWVDSVSVVQLDSSDRMVGSVGKFPGLSVVMRGAPTLPWFSPKFVAASGPRHLFVGFGDDYTIRVFNDSGRHVSTIVRDHTPRIVTSEDKASFSKEWAKRWTRGGSSVEATTARIRGGDFSERVPAYSSLLAGADGSLWVREPNLADAPASGRLDHVPVGQSRWSVFSDRGQWLEDVVLPARFLPTNVGTDFVLGVAVDDDGVETIALYRLTVQ